MRVFQEGPLADFLSRFTDLILLNILWFVCSLPVFTLGASTCAVYEVTLHYAFHEEPSIVQTFLGTFRKCFLRATGLFLIFLGAGLFLGVDFWCALQWDVSMKFVFIVVILAVFYFYLAVLSHVFPILAYYGCGVKETIRKAFVLSMSNGIFTVFVMVMDLVPVFAILLLPRMFGQILFLYFVIGFSAIAMLNSLHLARLFDPERAKEADQLEEQQRQLRDMDKEQRQEK